MHVLFTNNTLLHLAGSELYIYALALEYRRRGIEVTCFTLRQGEIGERLKQAGITVTSDLSTVKNVDVIHGQHRLEARVAAAYFPQTPVVYACLGPVHPFERPSGGKALFTRYVAVSELVRKALVIKDGVPEDKIEFIPNFVDTERFKSTRPINRQPKRVLILTNYFKAEGIVRRACELAGVAEIKEIGQQSASVWDVENYIEWADLVFSRGTGAFQALAMGRPVMVFRPEHADGLVTPENFEEMAANNFSSRIRLLDKGVDAEDTTAIEPTAEFLAAEIGKANPDDAQLLMEKVRERYSVTAIATKLLAVYRTAQAEFLEEWENNPQGRGEAVSRDLGEYLVFLQEADQHRENLPGYKRLDGDVRRLLDHIRGLQDYIQQADQHRLNREATFTAQSQTLSGDLQGLAEDFHKLEAYTKSLEAEFQKSAEYAKKLELELQSTAGYARSLEKRLQNKIFRSAFLKKSNS